MAKVFVSYRRADNAAGYAMDLARILRESFGERHVFRDMRSIPPGVDFGDYIRGALQNCAVMLVMIGRHWVNERTDDGSLRLFEPGDWVRIEVATALAAEHVRVIPVLVGGATLPRSDQLPPDLQPLLHRNAVSLEDRKWESDVASLVVALEKVPGLRSWWDRLLRRLPRQKAPTGRKKRIALTVGGLAVATVGIAAVELADFTPSPTPNVNPEPVVIGGSMPPPLPADWRYTQLDLNSASAAPNLERAALPQPSATDISGIWMDHQGNRYRFDQEDDEFTIQQISGLTAQIGHGDGYIEDRTVEFDFYLGEIYASSSSLVLAPDGRTMQGTVEDAFTEETMRLYLQRF